MPDTPRCGLPHYTWPESVCTEPAGHQITCTVGINDQCGCGPGSLIRTDNPAYDAVYAYIRTLGDYLPPDPVHRNAIIWRAVHAALGASGATNREQP